MEKKHESIILKGVASQLLQMENPSFKDAEELFSKFGVDFQGTVTYAHMYRAIKIVALFEKWRIEEWAMQRKIDASDATTQFVRTCIHFAMKGMSMNEITDAVFKD